MSPAWESASPYVHAPSRPPVGDGVLDAPFPCHSEPVRALAWESVSPCLPLRGRWQRVALTEGAISHGNSSPPVTRADSLPPRWGLAARRCRADGTSYPKGICSAALHGRTPSPTGGSTHLPHRAGSPSGRRLSAGVSSRAAEQSIPPVMQCAHLPFRRQQASSYPLTCHGMVPQASRTALFRHNKAPRLSSRGFVLALPIFPGRLQPSIVSRSELN